MDHNASKLQKLLDAEERAWRKYDSHTKKCKVCKIKAGEAAKHCKRGQHFWDLWHKAARAVAFE